MQHFLRHEKSRLDLTSGENGKKKILTITFPTSRIDAAIPEKLNPMEAQWEKCSSESRDTLGEVLANAGMCFEGRGARPLITGSRLFEESLRGNKKPALEERGSRLVEERRGHPTSPTRRRMDFSPFIEKCKCMNGLLINHHADIIPVSLALNISFHWDELSGALRGETASPPHLRRIIAPERKVNPTPAVRRGTVNKK